MKLKHLILATLLLSGTNLASAQTVAAAGNASLSLSPSSQTVTQGSNLTVNIYVNGTEMTNVTVRLSYDAARLSCSSGSFSGSNAFPNTVSPSCGGGVAKITRSINGGDAPISGSQHVASLTFQTIATGVANISVTSGSQIPNNGVNDWNGQTPGVNYAINAPITETPSQPANQSTGTGTNKPKTTVPTTDSNEQKPTAQAEEGAVLNDRADGGSGGEVPTAAAENTQIPKDGRVINIRSLFYPAMIILVFVGGIYTGRYLKLSVITNGLRSLKRFL